MNIREIYQKYIAPHNAEIIFCLILLVMSCVVIMFKKNYHNDEIFSYGSANYISDDGVGRLNVKPAPYTYTPAGDVFYEYLTVQEEDPFQIAHVWENQASDVHPPLYYLCLYVISFCFKGVFTKWIGGGINIICILLALIAVRKLSAILGHSEWETRLISIFFVLSPGILMQVAFMRMYVMAMCEVTWLTYLIIKNKQQESDKYYVLIGMLCVAGGLTHYYFLIYLFFISAFYCLYLVFSRKIASLFKYIITMACAGGAVCAIFPAILSHIFGGESRGKESFDNLHGDIAQLWDKIKFFYNKINSLLFGGIIFLLCVWALCVIIYMVRKEGIIELIGKCRNLNSNLIYGLAVICYFLLTAKISVGHNERYVYLVFGVMIVGVLHGVVVVMGWYISQNKKELQKITILLMTVMLFLSIKNCGWDYCFYNSDQLVETIGMQYGHLNALCVVDSVKHQNKIRERFLEICKLKSITFFEKNVNELENMEHLRDNDMFILYVTDDVYIEEIVREIKEYCPQIDLCEKLGEGSRYTDVYLLSGN